MLPPTMPKDDDSHNQFLPLSRDDMDELSGFLMSDVPSDEVMMLDTLHGYLTAIVIGPTSLDFGQWFPGIWGSGNDDLPNFRTMEEAKRIIDLVVRLLNGIILDLEAELDSDLEAFAPIFDTLDFEGREYDDAGMWAFGFMCGIDLCRKDWQPFFNNHNGEEILRPICLLGSDDLDPEEFALIETPEQRHEMAQQIPARVTEIYRFWLPYREATVERAVAAAIQREQPEIGRDDPCPCGSGVTFKKCCGVAGTLH